MLQNVAVKTSCGRHIAVALAMVSVCVGCAGGDRPTLGGPTSSAQAVATTTAPPAGPPSAALRDATRAFLAGAGAPILGFERRTSGLLTDPGDDLTVMRRFERENPTGVEHDRLFALISAVPDPVLKQRFYEDIALRIIMMGGAQAAKRPRLDLVARLRATARSDANAVETRLRQFGLSLTRP